MLGALGAVLIVSFILVRKVRFIIPATAAYFIAALTSEVLAHA